MTLKSLQKAIDQQLAGDGSALRYAARELFRENAELRDSLRRAGKTKLEEHRCNGCGKTAMKDPRSRQYCDCNPNAPFYMTPTSIDRLARSAVGRLKATITYNENLLR